MAHNTVMTNDQAVNIKLTRRELRLIHRLLRQRAEIQTRAVRNDRAANTALTKLQPYARIPVAPQKTPR